MERDLAIVYCLGLVKISMTIMIMNINRIINNFFAWNDVKNCANYEDKVLLGESLKQTNSIKM